jgi:hypothetical protein
MFVFSLTIDRLLRHKGRLAPDHQKKEKITSCLAIIFAALGGLALIFLSIFDVRLAESWLTN